MTCNLRKPSRTKPTFFVGINSLLIGYLLLLNVPNFAFGEGLPPNWEAGRAAKLRLRPRESLNQSQEQSISDNRRNRSDIWGIGFAVSVPELLKLDLNFMPSPFFHLGLSVSPGWPFAITVEMPSDVIKSDKTNTIAAAYTAFDANFKATWGPHLSLNAAWHPFGGTWFLMGGGGFRELRLTGSASSQLRVCTVAEAIKEPPCGNDQASLQTRNRLEIEADAVLTSIMFDIGTGWLWRPTAHSQLILALGATRAKSTTSKIKVSASIIDPDGTPQEISGSLSDLKSKSEQDVGAKADSELRKFADQTLPVASLGLAYGF